MLVVFKAGPITDNTAKTYDEMDVIDVIPRHKEAVIKARGLGRKATRFFWVEVDTDRLSDKAWNNLMTRITEPVREMVESVPRSIGTLAPPIYILKRKRKMKLRGEELEKLDANFKAVRARNTHNAEEIFPKRRLTVSQLRRLLVDKDTGRDLNGD